MRGVAECVLDFVCVVQTWICVWREKYARQGFRAQHSEQNKHIKSWCVEIQKGLGSWCDLLEGLGIRVLEAICDPHKKFVMPVKLTVAVLKKLQRWPVGARLKA
jgi:hypothetical protein